MKLTKLPSGKIIATIEGDTHIGRWAIESGRLDHDQNTLPLLRPFIPQGGTVIDVGAFIGDHTIFYAECVGPTGAVVAMEPNDAAFFCLKHNMQAHGNAVCLNVGASDSAHGIDIAQSLNSGASHAIEGIGSACIAIDSLNLDRCDFIKMDCEGFEVRALKGAFATIRKHSPAMLIEVNAAALERQGYHPKDIYSVLHHLRYTYRNIYQGEPCEGLQFDILAQPIASPR